jgi:hypothetical protein
VRLERVGEPERERKLGADDDEIDLLALRSRS